MRVQPGNFDESAECYALRYDADGRLGRPHDRNARWLLERDGAIVVTPPQLRVEPGGLAEALAAASRRLLP